MLPEVNNSFYDELGERWYQDTLHPVALLRCEAKAKLQYVQRVFSERGLNASSKILDIGCGAGFISLPLASLGYTVKGIDLSPNSIEIARKHARPGERVEFAVANAYELPEKAQSYDVVLLLDFLEHINDPVRAISEAGRVLRPGGILMVHTFNRTLLSRLIVIKGMELILRDCPKHLHVYHLFRKPSELRQIGETLGLTAKEFLGVRPKFLNRAFFSSLLHRRIDPNFEFTFTPSLAMGYLGYFVKVLE